MTVLDETETDAAGAARAASGAAASTSAPKGASKWVIDENELLASTAEHRLWTFGPMALMAAATAVAASHVHGAGDAAAGAAAVLAAYVLSDLGTGVYHWGVDNYGDGSTPVFGRQIAAFQGHHQRPWTITQREFCNNLHQVFKPAALPAAGILALSPLLGVGAGFFLPSFLFLVCMSQQFHAWSHMKKSELPGAVVALQDAGVLIGRRAHGAHHKPNFEGNYCIVSGWWNEPLDNAGFFRWLEKVVVARTGVEPRCWYAPDHDWAEQVEPTRN
ncbi:MAG: low CO2-induced protein [Monoraphidium minutum]|nr:MAG: low CO2-induced protein [Monoraphidium minutum]